MMFNKSTIAHYSLKAAVVLDEQAVHGHYGPLTLRRLAFQSGCRPAVMGRVVTSLTRDGLLDCSNRKTTEIDAWGKKQTRNRRVYSLSDYARKQWGVADRRVRCSGATVPAVPVEPSTDPEWAAIQARDMNEFFAMVEREDLDQIPSAWAGQA